MSPTPATEKSTAARYAAELSWANTVNRSARTAPARNALWQKFLDQVDGDPVRAKHLWKAHFAHLALKSAQARRRVRENAEQASAAGAALKALGHELPPVTTEQATAEGGAGA